VKPRVNSERLLVWHDGGVAWRRGLGSVPAWTPFYISTGCWRVCAQSLLQILTHGNPHGIARNAVRFCGTRREAAGKQSYSVFFNRITCAAGGHKRGAYGAVDGAATSGNALCVSFCTATEREKLGGRRSIIKYHIVSAWRACGGSGSKGVKNSRHVALQWRGRAAAVTCSINISSDSGGVIANGAGGKRQRRAVAIAGGRRRQWAGGRQSAL